jgi:hypothetical protein
MSKWDRIAYLTPGADGYSVIRSDLGLLTVALKNIAPYANGSRVTLRFGNTTSATINGVKATLEWGSVDEKGHAINATAKSKNVTFNEPLRTGSWTSVAVVLEGVPATNLGFVRVKDLDHTGIRLSR